MRAELYLGAIKSCPIVTPEELTAGDAFVVLSPHPDDETLGTGGLIAGACAVGQKVDVVVVTDGAGSHPRSKQYPPQRLVELRYSEVHRAGLVLGMQPDRVKFLGLPDTKAPKSGPCFDAAVAKTVEVIRSSGATTLFVTWEGDPHCDHVASAELAKAVRRLLPGLKLWAYPVWGWHLEPTAETHQPSPEAYRIDISPYRVQKLEAIKAHVSQMTDLIGDDPQGFRFDEKSLAPFLGNYEYFVEVPV